MADIEIVIRIPEEKLGWIKEYPDVYTGWQNESIRNGTPLPKGHKRLIEVTPQLEQELFTFTRYTGIDEYPYESAIIIMDNAPTIIKAESEE